MCVCVCVCVCVYACLGRVWLRPMDCRPPGSPVHGIFQARRILEWLTISYSSDLPEPGIKSVPLASPAFVDWFFTTCTTWEAHRHYYLSLFYGYEMSLTWLQGSLSITKMVISFWKPYHNKSLKKLLMFSLENICWKLYGTCLQKGCYMVKVI